MVSTAAGAGERISAGVPNLLRIAVNLSDLDAVVEPPPPVLARVRPGAESLVMFAETGDALAGTVREVAGSQVIVEFASPNPAHQARHERPGQAAIGTGSGGDEIGGRRHFAIYPIRKLCSSSRIAFSN